MIGAGVGRQGDGRTRQLHAICCTWGRGRKREREWGKRREGERQGESSGQAGREEEEEEEDTASPHQNTRSICSPPASPPPPPPTLSLCSVSRPRSPPSTRGEATNLPHLTEWGGGRGRGGGGGGGCGIRDSHCASLVIKVRFKVRLFICRLMLDGEFGLYPDYYELISLLFMYLWHVIR